MNIFSKKPALKNLIPDNFVDIHSHLLPGIDDGSKSTADTELLMDHMNGFGIKNFITTPHVMTNVWDNNESIIQNTLNQTIHTIDSNLYERFSAAAEYMIDSYFTKRLEQENLLTLKDDYILIEMSYLSPPINLYEIIFEIQLKGYRPILAHPERYIFFHQNFSEYEKLKSAGCTFQLNLLSTVDYYGKMITKIAGKLLKNELIDFVGTDIHHINHINAFDRKISISEQKQLEIAIEKNLFFHK